jgi:predicted nucleotide-binding protein (sugar kinase/HSP70/actin superfamily)
MSDEGAATFAAACRSVGVDAAPVLPSNERTLELGGRYTSGDECYPAKITIGDFLRAIEEVGPERIAFFMPTASGPCRFGQYAPYLKKVLRERGYSDIPIVSPTSSNGYDGIGEHAGDLVRTSWRALVVADTLRKLRLRFRPYEVNTGETDRVTEACLDDVCRVLEQQGIDHTVRMERLIEAMIRVRNRFRSILTKDTQRPLVGVVGEIFCRLSTFSNEEIVRTIEDHGGECWLSDIAEWIWYTNEEQKDRLIRMGKRFSGAMLKAKLKNAIQRKDERALYEPVRDLLKDREEPEDVGEILDRSLPYLPHYGALGEMVLSIGKAIYLYEKGVSGIADISPFTCMNGIICEAIYPRVSAEHNGIPIKMFYFDGTQKTVDQDVGIFMELVRNYQRKSYSPQRARHRVPSSGFRVPS